MFNISPSQPERS